MSVTLQLSPPSNLQNTPLVMDINAPPDRQPLLKVVLQWMVWFNTVWRVLNYVKIGTGSPEAVVSAPVGTLFLRIDGGANTTLYVKESGTGNTGWAAK